MKILKGPRCLRELQEDSGGLKDKMASNFNAMKV